MLIAPCVWVSRVWDWCLLFTSLHRFCFYIFSRKCLSSLSNRSTYTDSDWNPFAARLRGQKNHLSTSSNKTNIDFLGQLCTRHTTVRSESRNRSINFTRKYCKVRHIARFWAHWTHHRTTRMLFCFFFFSCYLKMQHAKRRTLLLLQEQRILSCFNHIHSRRFIRTNN